MVPFAILTQTWLTFLTNHLAQTAAIDFFTVPTATFRVLLFVFLVLSHDRRRVVHFGVTEHPTQECASRICCMVHSSPSNTSLSKASKATLASGTAPTHRNTDLATAGSGLLLSGTI